ncbi:S24 family peptidase [Phytobacter sp. RSE-02]|uniref:XRE family transcriptional regulator n=1 Tax=Phytobacter sp. RSE-02 TaxID=3229229 RepID=UPI00339D9539
MEDLKRSSIEQFSLRLKSLVQPGTGRAFAKKAGIGYSTLHNYLSAASSPTLDNLVLLANAANVTIEWLATGKENDIGPEREGIVSVPFIDHSQPNLKLDSSLLNELDRASLVALKVDTDAMYPTFNVGSILIIDKNDKEILDNKIIVLPYKNSYLSKRVQIAINEIILLSDNPVSPPVSVSERTDSKLEIVGTVKLIINSN